MACVLVDAHGHRHLFIQKVPIVTLADLDESSAYPQPGIIRCEILHRWTDEEGRSLSEVTTERPDAVNATSGETRFVVLSSSVAKA